jgi:predicted ATP-dependent protease
MANEQDIPKDHLNLNVYPVETIREVLDIMLIKNI